MLPPDTRAPPLIVRPGFEGVLPAGGVAGDVGVSGGGGVVGGGADPPPGGLDPLPPPPPPLSGGLFLGAVTVRLIGNTFALCVHAGGAPPQDVQVTTREL